MKIAICDDNLVDIKCLRKLIQASKLCPSNVEFAEFTSGEELLACYTNFDAIFLDMQMDDMNGRETAREIRNRDANVILSFYSAYTECAHNILDYHILKYLLKNSGEEKLTSDIDQILKEINYKKRKTRIRVQHYNTSISLKVSDILYIEINGKGSRIWITKEAAEVIGAVGNAKDGWLLKSSKSIKNYYQDLKESGFVYASRSYIVNIENIIIQSKEEITVKGGKKLSVTRGMKKTFEKDVARYWELKYKETRG